MPANLPSLDVRKTLTDTGYIVVGLGVMGVQQAQTRSRELRTRLDGRAGGALEQGRSALEHTTACAKSLTTDLRTRLGAGTRSARERAEAGVRDTVGKAHDLRTELGKRTEPVVGIVQVGLGGIPERVVQVVEPVTTRVRNLGGSAA
ncbi:MAG: hypothetical protein ACKOOG_07705 [Actinomycetota bacterium]